MSSCNVTEETKFVELVLEAAFILTHVIHPFLDRDESSLFLGDFVFDLLSEGLITLSFDAACTRRPRANHVLIEYVRFSSGFTLYPSHSLLT